MFTLPLCTTSYLNLLDQRAQVYIVAAPSLYQNQVVQSIIRQFSAEVYEDSIRGDFLFAVMAPTLIGSFGTYTWMAAFLSAGHSIHLPYSSNLEHGSDWCPWKDLFIHDDPRIIYHDVANPSVYTSETAETVLSRNTVFAHALKKRKDPCRDI